MRVTRGVIPLYYQIAQILRSQIHAQEYKPDDPLPTEDELIRRLGVSRTTVRQAFQLLLNEGLIHRIAGKGTFVASGPTTRQADWSIENFEGLIRVGPANKVRLLGTEIVRAADALAKTFQIPPGSEVWQCKKLLLVDDEPFFHATLHVPADLAGKVPTDRLEERAVFLLLEEYGGIRIREACQWLAAALADGDIARHLRLSAGDAVLLAERHFMDETGRVVEIATDHYRTDQMRYFLQLKRQQPGRATVLG